MLPPPLFSLNVFPAELMFQKAPTPFETNYNGRPSFSFFFLPPLSLSLSARRWGVVSSEMFPCLGATATPTSTSQGAKGGICEML